MVKYTDNIYFKIFTGLIFIIIIIFIVYYFSIIDKLNNLKKLTKIPKHKPPVNIDDIEILYDTKSFITVENNKINNKYNLTYGELTFIGMKNISEYCDRKGIPKENFIDLGCGNGRTLAYAVYNGFENAKGTEIVDDRYKYAINAREKMDDYMKNKIELSHGDIFDLNSEYFPPNSVIFISNLLYPKKTNQELIKHLNNITPKGVIIIISKLPNNLYDFKLIEQLNIPMSWESKSKCYIIQK